MHQGEEDSLANAIQCRHVMPVCKPEELWLEQILAKGITSPTYYCMSFQQGYCERASGLQCSLLAGTSAYRTVIL